MILTITARSESGGDNEVVSSVSRPCFKTETHIRNAILDVGAMLIKEMKQEGVLE